MTGTKRLKMTIYKSIFKYPGKYKHGKIDYKKHCGGKGSGNVTKRLKNIPRSNHHINDKSPKNTLNGKRTK